MSILHTKLQDILSNVAADGFGQAMGVIDFDTVCLTIDTANSANMKIEVFGTPEDTEPTWASAQSLTNRYYELQTVNYDDGDTVDGSTGITLAGTDTHRYIEINTNLLSFINIEISGYAAGNITVSARGCNRG